MIIKPSRTFSAIDSNTIEVPRQTSFHVPEGRYTSSIHTIRKLTRNFSIPLVRIVFKILIEGSHIDYLAKLDLKADLHEGSELWTLIRNILGRKALQDASESSFDLDSLVGVEVDLEIAHILDKAADYEFPLVVVTDVQAPGSLVSPF